jgi:cytochrome c-type biogenesis protein
VDAAGVLLATAVALGTLSFYEPCTIATHTLFAARAHATMRGARGRALAEFVVARCTLLAAVFAGAAMVGPVQPPGIVAAAALLAIGLVYLVTRRRYLPVPHVEAFRLLPMQDRLPDGVKLALTLPACTLPLAAITAAIGAAVGRPGLAAVAGVLFGATFAAPTLRHVTSGLGPARRRFLARAATATPWLTAGLLWGGALWVWQASG